MHRFRITYHAAPALRRAIEEEIARGVVLVKVEPPDGIEFADRCVLEIVSPHVAQAARKKVIVK